MDIMENKTLLFMKGLVLVVLIILTGWLVKFNLKGGEITVKEGKFDYKNTTYFIEGDVVTLTDGFSERDVAPGSASKSITRYFGNEVFADINNDSVKDVAFLLTQSDGGTGSFYYLAVALGTSDGSIGINTVFLGDRIAPQNTQFNDGIIVVNYADRNPGESFDISPSLGVSKYFSIINYLLTEVDVSGDPIALAKVATPEEKCLAERGTFDAIYKECLGVDSITCKNIGGVFNPCASACRHDPTAVVCTMQCAIVCKFK